MLIEDVQGSNEDDGEQLEDGVQFVDTQDLMRVSEYSDNERENKDGGKQFEDVQDSFVDANVERENEDGGE